MQFRKWPHYLRERKSRHLRVNGSSGPETPLGCMALMQTTSPQGEQGALGPESPLGRIRHAAMQTETHLPYLHPDQNQWIRPRSKEVQPPRRNPSPTHPYLRRRHTLPPRRVRTGSLPLTRVLIDKRKRFLASTERKSARTSSPTLPTEPTHKI